MDLNIRKMTNHPPSPVPGVHIPQEYTTDHTQKQ